MNEPTRRALLIGALPLVALPALGCPPVARFGETYVAFSVRRAAELFSSGKAPQAAQELAGITAIRGVILDSVQDDLVLVGTRDPDRGALTADDLCVALRARFAHEAWPLVSIDPEQDAQGRMRQTVRFEGGIEGTAFGRSLFDADLRLKEIAMGLAASHVPEVRSYWDLTLDEMRESHASSEVLVNARFWFYPVLPVVSVRENVAALRGLNVEVFTQVLGAERNGVALDDLTDFRNEPGTRFAQMVTHAFDSLARKHVAFRRLRGLLELVALSRAIEELPGTGPLDYWLSDHRPAHHPVDETIDILERKTEVTVARETREYSLSGGVQLTALALRLDAGDVSALRDVVLGSRPAPETTAWEFTVADAWILHGDERFEDARSLAALYSHGCYLYESGDYDRAIACWRRVLRSYPEDADLNDRIGAAFRNKGLESLAAEFFTKSLEIKRNRFNQQGDDQ